MPLRLLPPELLVKTGPVDHADWNYRPLLSYISRQRHRLCLKLMPVERPRLLLEIGYGSGVFMPELAARCEELHGIDIHPHAAEVSEQLARYGLTAHLKEGSAEALPYGDATFDLVVALSALEFVDDPRAAAREICRVLRPGGCCILVTPGQSPVVDWGLKMLTGESATSDYAGRRAQLMPALLEHLAIDARRTFPPVISGVVCLYSALRMKPRIACAAAESYLPALEGTA
jgi:ubiquinone/menaquinone biosynthesis C-methylase UbiE